MDIEFYKTNREMNFMILSSTMKNHTNIYNGILALICCMLTCPLLSTSQTTVYSYRKPPASLFNKYQKSIMTSVILNAEKKAYDVTQDLPANYVKNASVDYTSYLQNVIDHHDSVVMPDFPVLVNINGLKAKSNSTIVFKPHSKLILQPNDQRSYAVIAVYNVENVNIYNPQIVGDKDKHTGTKGEWGMGISIKASKNINIVNPIISSCWGDGIYIGGMNNVTSDNIKIYNAQLDANRRNGISVVSANGLLIQSPVISNTSGTFPMAGIDLEPDTNADELKNIDIENPITYNNAQQGIFIVLDHFIGQQTKQIAIKVNNQMDENSNYAFGFHNLKNSNANQPFTGEIDILNPQWKSKNQGIQHFNSFKNGLKFNIQNVRIIEGEQTGNIQVKKPTGDALIKSLQ